MIEVIKKVDGERVQNLSYILGLDYGKVKMEKIISYSQLMDPFEATNKDTEISDDLYKFRALMDDQGPPQANRPQLKRMQVQCPC